MLKLLCLFTYADIRAVNPEALTPWKAESLWQLYVSTANYMSRSLDEERIHAQAHVQQFVERILPLVPERGFAEGSHRVPRRIAAPLRAGPHARGRGHAFPDGPRTRH